MLENRRERRFRPILSDDFSTLVSAEYPETNSGPPSLTKPVPKSSHGPIALTTESLATISSCKSIPDSADSRPLRRSSVLIPADNSFVDAVWAEGMEPDVAVSVGPKVAPTVLSSSSSAFQAINPSSESPQNILQKAQHGTGPLSSFLGDSAPQNCDAPFYPLISYEGSTSSSDDSDKVAVDVSSRRTITSIYTTNSHASSEDSFPTHSRQASRSISTSLSDSKDDYRESSSMGSSKSVPIQGTSECTNHFTVDTEDTQKSLLPLLSEASKDVSSSSPPDTVKVSKGVALSSEETSSASKLQFQHYHSSSRERSGTEPLLKTKSLVKRSSSEVAGVGNELNFERKLSRQQIAGIGGRAAAKLLDKIQKVVVADEEDDNPWFQHRVHPANSSGVPSTSNDASGKLRKEKKKMFRNLGQLFRKEEKDAIAENDIARKTSSSSDSLSGSQGLPDEGTSSCRATSREASVDAEQVQEDIKQAVASKQSLETVIDLALCLAERPDEEVSKLLFRYMATPMAIHRGMTLLLHGEVETLPPNLSTPDVSGNVSFEPRHREFVMHAFVNGPSRLRKAIFNHTIARAELLNFLKKEHVGGRREARKAFGTHCAAKLLNSLLSENPSELAEYLAGKKGFLHTLVRSNIHVPEVVDFVVQLCAANALLSSGSDELRYGAQNAAGIVLLSEESICNLLVHMFVEASNPASAITHEELRWQRQVMCMRCLLELSKRSVVVPKFSKANCSYSGKHIKKVNAALDNINVFENLTRVGILLDAGIASVAFNKQASRPITAEERNNGAVCALSYVTDMLEMVQAAVASKSIVTRRTVGSIRTDDFEALVLPKALELAKLLGGQYHDRVKGRLRVGIVRMLRCLLESKVEKTGATLCGSAVPDLLLETLTGNPHSSIVQRCVVACIASSAKRKGATALHKAWFRAMQKPNGLLADLTKILGAEPSPAGTGAARSRTSTSTSTNTSTSASSRENGAFTSTYRSTVVDIGFVVSRMSQSLTRAEFRALFTAEETYAAFIGTVEPGLGRVEERRRGACGGPKPEGNVVSVLADAESLAARLNDYDAV